MTTQSKQRPITEEWMQRAAAHYLGRYASTKANLERVLERKVRRRAAALGEDAGDYISMIRATVARFEALKLLDDAAYAEMKLAGLRRRGASRAKAAATLSEKGVPAEIVDEALAADETEEQTAAYAYARRRRFGPFRARGRAERRDRDIAAMVRAGFPFALAAGVIDDRDAGE